MRSIVVKPQSKLRTVLASVAMIGVLAISAASVRAGEEKPWSGSVAVGLSLTTGNNDTVLVNGGIKGDKIWPNDELHLGLDGAYGKNDGKESTEVVHGMAQYNRLFNERLYGSLLADYLHDGIAELSYRVTLAPGLGYYLIKSDPTKLALEVGPAFVIEKKYGIEERKYWTVRFADRFEHKLSDTAKIWQMTEYLPQVDDFQNNYKLNTEVGVEASLTKAMSLRLVGQHRYDSQPAPGKRYYDILVTSALAYKF